MIVFLLWFLATLDSAFIGYREAAGRNALINKRDYYIKAMIRGAIWGQFAVLIGGGLILIFIFLSSESQNFIEELQKIGVRMLFVYVPFTAIILTAFVIRTIPSVDIKSITSTVIFGPFTLLRPFVAIGGMIYGLLEEPKFAFLLIGLFILAMMLGMEWFLTKLRELKN